jgi:hypothetical protein
MNIEEMTLKAINYFKSWAHSHNQRFDENMFRKVVSEQGLYAADTLACNVIRRYEQLLRQK